MKLTVLCENVAGGRLQAEHGLSYLIEYKGETLLFDTGHSDLFIKNAKVLGIDVQQKVKTVVLSHGHWDHGNGLTHLTNKTLIAHPAATIKRYRKTDNSYIGLSLSKLDLQQRFSYIESKKPYFIQPHILFLGEIPRLNNFEAQHTTFKDENGNDDFVLDDSALVIIKNNALIILVGCSHAGVCNIIDYAQKITSIDKIEAVIGGFHLKEKDYQTQKTIEYFCKINVNKIYPTHCTELPALSLFYETFGIRQLKTGDVLEL